jgi:hypothetical protein
MSTVTMGRGGRFGSSGDESSKRGVAFWAGLILGLALLAFLAAWLLGWFRFTTDPRVEEVLQLQEEARQKFMANGGPQTIAEATEAVATMGMIRQKVESLPEPLREQASRSGGSMFRSMMRAQINAYFDAPPEKRKEELDRQIKQEEMMRKAFQAASAVGGFFSGGGGGSGGPGGTGGGAAQTAGGTGQAGQGGDQQAGQSQSPDERRNVWMKRILDTTTPEQRARYVEYRRAKEVRRVELGLPASPWSR